MYIAITEKNISQRICTPLCDAIQLVIKSIGACFRVAMKSMYNIPKMCIANTPNIDKRTILKKSVLTLSKVPEKNIAGINAKIYPNPYSNK